MIWCLRPRPRSTRARVRTRRLFLQVRVDGVDAMRLTRVPHTGIDWDKTCFPDNTPCIELLTKRPIGILRLLDSECSRGFVASDGAKLVAKVNKAHAASPFFEVCGPASVWRRKDGSRTEDADFLVHHFAGPIVYTVSSFVEKNRDAAQKLREVREAHGADSEEYRAERERIVKDNAGTTSTR